MTAFVDTSALVAVLDADDEHHKAARDAWEFLLDRDALLVTTNYVVLETCAVLQRSCGIDALRVFLLELLPVLSVAWVEEQAHQAGIAALLAAARRKLSLVDCTSFEMMRQRGITAAFAFDRHFAEYGFACVTAPGS